MFRHHMKKSITIRRKYSYRVKTTLYIHVHVEQTDPVFVTLVQGSINIESMNEINISGCVHDFDNHI